MRRSTTIQTTLAAVADELGAMWSSALARGDFEEITRVVDASHAVHRALVALAADTPGAA